MVTLRTQEMESKYQEHKRAEWPTGFCPLCEKESKKDFGFWKVVENSFPYDQIAKIHHLLLPLRHVTGKELRAEELEELSMIRDSFVNAGYDWVIEPTEKNKSLPDHFHLHLIIGK